MRVTTVWFGIALALSLRSGQAYAQVSGVVRDSVAGRRVPGAVITLLDSARKVVARSLADDSGRFRIDVSGAWVRVVKIGYRPKELRVSSPMLRIALDRLPNMLEPMLTSDQPKCPRNATRPAAFGLWEQAKAALLGTVVARETNLATVRRISFRRYMTPKGDAIARQSVERETSQGIRSFESVLKAAEFGTRGFAQTLSANQVEFYGPDAEVLLDDALPDYYCFELAGPQATRPNQAGLRFRPMKRADGRVDIDGTLWIDTVSRVLTDIEYLYLGLDRWATPFHPGGTISFEETSPTSVWIDRWWIRMTGARIASPGSLSLRGGAQHVQIVEGGGELVSARWPDGREWTGHLGTVDLTLVSTNRAPLAGAEVKLDSTDYAGITDGSGRVAIDELLPGPYTVSVYDSVLAVVDTMLPGSTGFTAARDSVARATVAVPSLVEFVARGCKAVDAFDPASKMLVARIVDVAGTPVSGAKWKLVPPLRAKDATYAPQGYYSYGETGANGMIFACTRLIQAEQVVLQAWPSRARNEVPAVEQAVPLAQRINATKLVLPP